MEAIEDKTAHKFARPDLPNIEDWVGRKIGLGSVRIKKFLKHRRDDEVNPLSSMLDGNTTEESLSVEVGKTTEGTREVRALFGESAFDYPKPVSLIRELVRQSTGPEDLVLDFFAGSATTAQAAMELNAEDGGSRRFIMVSSSEATEDEPDKNICRDVTAERIRLLNRSDDKKYRNLTAGFQCSVPEFRRRAGVPLEIRLWAVGPRQACRTCPTFPGPTAPKKRGREPEQARAPAHFDISGPDPVARSTPLDEVDARKRKSRDPDDPDR